MKKMKWLSYSVKTGIIVLSLYLVVCALQYPSSQAKDSDLVFLDTVQVQNDVITLPHEFSAPDNHSKVVLSTLIQPQKQDVLYIKSVYSPLVVYLNDEIIYEYGKEGTYPSYMIDPGTYVDMIPLPVSEEIMELRLEYEAPTSRSSMMVYPPIVGSEGAILDYLFNILGLPLIFSLLQVIVGILLVCSALFIINFEKLGKALLWLGIFAISTGIWPFGEYNLTALFIENATLLYLFAFIGLFSIIIPLIEFLIQLIDFKNEKYLRYISIGFGIATCMALILQLSGVLAFSTSMYFFHVASPIAIVILTVEMAKEAFLRNSRNAKRLLIPLTILMLSALAEILNYNLQFVLIFASIFQVGIAIFCINSFVLCGVYVKDVVLVNRTRQQLEFQVEMMKLQIDEQKKYNQMMAQNEIAVRQQQHDLRHQLKVIRELCHEPSQLCEYVDTLIENTPKTESRYCENVAVNIIVSYYASLFQQEQIPFHAKIAVSRHIHNVSDSDLCVVFANLLENALEACQRDKQEKKFVKISCVQEYSALIITMDNTFNGKFDRIRSGYLSSKRNELGVGLNSIHTISRKYGGSSRFEVKDDLFLSSVYFKI